MSPAKDARSLAEVASTAELVPDGAASPGRRPGGM